MPHDRTAGGHGFYPQRETAGHAGNQRRLPGNLGQAPSGAGSGRGNQKAQGKAQPVGKCVFPRSVQQDSAETGESEDA